MFLSRKFIFVVLFVLPFAGVLAQEVRPPSAFDGVWVINEELSDDTDKQVEKAIKAAGGKARSKKKGKGRYRGGPKEQAMYDHMAYDEVLRIRNRTPEVQFIYAEGFERIFYTDGRGRSASASGPRAGGRQDYSFGSWDGNTLFVESRPRDGGRTSESYTLESNGNRLRVTLRLEPLSFLEPIHIVRIYERSPATR